jgi:23S rRNA pseudouridine1911/1915/1917 synthase
VTKQRWFAKFSRDAKAERFPATIIPTPIMESADPEIPSDDPDSPDSAEEADVVHLRFRATKTQTRRIDQFLTERVPWLSRAAVQRLIDDDFVKINGKPTKSSYKIKAGDQLEMVAPPEPVNDLLPEPIPIDVIYEDEHLLALNKQADLIVHPARGRWTGTLVNGLVNYGKKWSTVNGNWRPGILHRLDRNTTGIMLVAKSDEAHWRMARQFENRTIQKTYLAVVHGVPELLADVIDMPIGKDRYVREKQAVRKIENGGRPAVTGYQIQQLLNPPGSPVEKQGKFSLVQLFPKTGRTHQLRVHMSAIGFPLVGDTIYGGRAYESGDFQFNRQALHAWQITFVHPGTLKPMTLQAPMATDMQQLIAKLGGQPIATAL